MFRLRDKGSNKSLNSLPPSSDPVSEKTQEKDNSNQSSSFIARNPNLLASYPFSSPLDSNLQ